MTGTASDEGAVADSDWTDVFIYNPSSTAIDVNWILGGLMPAESGQHSATGGGILPLRWKTRCLALCTCACAHRPRSMSRPIAVAARVATPWLLTLCPL